MSIAVDMITGLDLNSPDCSDVALAVYAPCQT